MKLASFDSPILSSLGGSDTVTGSCQEVVWGDEKFLIDAGLFQGMDEKEHKNKGVRVPEPKSLNAVFLTHAHLDHCGYLPRLAFEGLDCPIYCTQATKDLAELVMLDSASIMQGVAKATNKKVTSPKFRSDPLYRTQDVQRVLNLMKVVDWEDVKSIGSLSFCFYRAGHIPGASSVSLWKTENREEKILFSGDLGRTDDILVLPPTVSQKHSSVVIETTYGNRTHSSPDNELSSYNVLPKLIKKIKGNRGILLIPSFSIARSQLVLFLLKTLMEKDPSLKIPIYMDSKMGLSANKIFLKHHNELVLNKEEVEDVLAFCQEIKEPWQEENREQGGGPHIMISSSGMLTGGKVREHLKNMAPEKKNVIFFPGYLGEGTLGRQIALGDKVVSVGEEQVEINCEVYQAKDLSSHADQGQLLTWLKNCLKSEGKVWLNHGSEIARKAFLEILSEKNLDASLVPFDKKVSLF
ncbi:MAG: MBL fold metallo-hydrolase [Halobacteriovoraceae bacterium]|nr:MBL fold metallo-hydrolase [Halobacteriovoraceae bacterium]